MTSTAAPYTVEFASHSNATGAAAAYVTKPDGTAYGVVLPATGAAMCSCPDHMYRGGSCKHIKLAQNALREALSTYTVNGSGDAALVIRQAKEGWACISEHEGPDAWRLAAAEADRLNAARPKLPPQPKKASKAA